MSCTGQQVDEQKWLGQRFEEQRRSPEHEVVLTDFMEPLRSEPLDSNASSCPRRRRNFSDFARLTSTVLSL